MKKSMLVLICVLLCMFAFTAGVTAESILPNVLPDSNIPSGGVQLFNADPDDETMYSENAVTVNLAFYNCETDSFVVMPMTLTVEPKVAENYGVVYGATSSGADTGFTVGETDVTVADALCAAHEQYYGENFTPETMEQYITSDEFFGYVTKIFEVQGGEGISFYVNGAIPMAYNSEADYWYGYAINQCILEDGDFIYFFGYESMDLSEWVSAFDKTSVEAEVGEEVTLTLIGHAAMAWQDVVAAPIADMEVYVLNEDGSIGASYDQTTDSEGNVTLSFDAAGTYYVTAQGLVDGIGEIAAPYCVVTVTEAEPEVIGTPVTVTDNVIDIADYTVGSWSKYSNKVTNIAVSGANVESATEDGKDVYIVLDYATAANAEIKAVFGKSEGYSAISKLSQNIDTVTLENGTGTLVVTMTSARPMDGTAVYTLHFSLGAPPSEVPECVKAEDTRELYKSTSLEIDLSEYFSGASSYYLVDGDEKTLLEDPVYTDVPAEAGTYTLTFAASNVVGECPERVVITVTVKEITSGAWLGITTFNGSVDYVIFTDAEGNPIDGLDAYLEDTTIKVILPKSFDLSGKITATFSRTANSSGLPFLSTSTAFNQGTGSRTDVYNCTLKNGSGTSTMYLYNAAPKATANNYTTYKIEYKIANELPVLAEGKDASATAETTAGVAYSVTLADMFTDADGDALSYLLSVNGEAASAVELDENGAYAYTTNVAGNYTLVFTATDSKDVSTDTYTVNLTVKNSTETNDMTVNVPEGITPSFACADGFGDDGVDIIGDAITAVAGTAANGMVSYTISYPVNVETVSVRAEGWGGSSFAAEKDGSATLGKVKVNVVDFSKAETAAAISVAYGDHKAVGGENGQYLLVAGTEYVYTAVPSDSSTYGNGSQTATLEASADVTAITLEVPYKSPKTITVTTGATAQLFKYNKYYHFTEIEAKAVKDNGDGTSTYYFSTSQNQLSYRVSMEGKITKAGYWSGNSLNAVYTEADAAPDTRVDYSASGDANASVGDDSVLVNVNGQNHLSLGVDESYTLKGYRVWEIIMYSYENQILTPDFHFDILSGEDVISLTEKDSPSNGNDDWMTVTGLKEGTAIIEVTYDAMAVTGGNYSGLYGASDPARAGLVVVQVGGTKADVNFGIDSKASQGALVYSEANKKAWDAEFDTLYFLGDSGELKLSPTAADDTITEVAVSNDKGENWTALTAEEDVYTAPIVSGNNIIRVTTEKGVAYQVVRGDQLEYTMSVVQQEGAETVDTVVDPGDTVRIVFEGLHTPIPKMAGNYNPGYKGNYDGDSSVHMVYTMGDQTISGAGVQYTFAADGNYIDVTVPADTEAESVTLEDGYISVGVLGLTSFADGGDSHRNIPDGGCATRASETTFHTRSMLPNVTIKLGDLNFVNTPPAVAGGAMTEAEIMFGQKCAINPELLFTDKDGQDLTYTVSVNDGEAQTVTATYKFVPDAVGVYTLTFTASDGEAETTHVVTVNVKQNPDNPDSLDFGLDESEIAGYVTVSFEDHALRVEGEKGLKYPEALGTIVEPTKVPYKEGDNVAAVTIRLLDALNIGYAYSGSIEEGFYLGAIKNFVVDDTPYASMAEFDAGNGSGWMITLNDVFITKGCSDFDVNSNDVVRWQYTCQFGADIGDPYFDHLHMEVEALIAAIGEVTLESEDVINEARAAYDDLNAYQQGRVENYDTLTAAEDRYKALVKAAEDKAAADQKAADDVEALISAIGNVTKDSEEAIKAARAAYDGLSADQKALVENYAVLTAAEAAYADLTKVIDPSELPFTDLTADWYKEAIAYVYSYGLMNGTSKTTFAPDDNLNRAMMATILYRIEGSPKVTSENPFTDVEAGQWYSDAIVWAAENGIVTGYGNGIFQPATNITREQMACMMYRYAAFKGADVNASDSLSEFTDAGNVSSWAAKEMKWAVAVDLMNGMGDGTLAPQGTATRAQAATVLMRFNENIL